MIRKYGTINEEVNRIKSLFGESRLYGNLVEQSDEIDNSNSIVCTESGCKGEYSGVEHNTDVKPSDVAHQFSNTMSTDVGNKLKELYEEGIYVKVDFDGIEMTTEGMDQKDDVVYKLNIPFKKVDEKCKAMTSFDHVGGWGHSPKLEARKGELSGVLLSGDELDISELKKTTEGLEEYWIQWRNKNTQSGCEDIVDIQQNNDDKPEGWYEKPVGVLQDYGVPDYVIDKMELCERKSEFCDWKYEDSEFFISIEGEDVDNKRIPLWGKLFFIKEGNISEYWVGKLIYVWDIGKDSQNSNETEGKHFKGQLLDGKYNRLFDFDEYGVDEESIGEIKNGYITIGGETTDPFKVGGEIVKSEDEEIYKKVQELRSKEEIVTQTDTDTEDGSEIPTLDIDSKTAIVKGYLENEPENGEYDTFESSDSILVYKIKSDDNTDNKVDIKTADNTDNKVDIKSDDKSEMKEGYKTEEDIIHKSSKLNKKYNIGKFVYDKKNDEFKIKSKYPFLLKKSKMVMKSMDETFWKTLNKWYDKPLNSDNTTLDIINDKKFKVKKKI